MAGKNLIGEMLLSFGFGEVMEALLPSVFDKKGSSGDKKTSGPEPLKSDIGGIGIKDEVIVLLGDYNSLPKAWKEISLQPNTISLIAHGFRQELSPLQRGKIERICGLREDTAKTSEHWLDKDGKKIDESAPIQKTAKGQPKGPQKMVKVIEREMQNQIGKHIMILFFAIGSDAIGKDPDWEIIPTSEMFLRSKEITEEAESAIKRISEKEMCDIEELARLGEKQKNIQEISSNAKIARDKIFEQEKNNLKEMIEKNAQRKVLSGKEKAEFNKAIAAYLKNRGILRDFSDQADEMAKEAEETLFAFGKRLGLNHANIDEMRAGSEDFLRKADIKLQAAKARARR